jgi:hypothetical protein
MKYARLASLFLLVVVWGSIERSIGITPFIGLCLGASIACAFELRIGLSLASGSTMMALGEWTAGLPVGAWALGSTLGLIACHLVLHTARPGAIERAAAMVMIVAPGLVCSLVFSLATGGATGIPGIFHTLTFVVSGYLLSGPLVHWLHGQRRELWGQPG